MRRRRDEDWLFDGPPEAPVKRDLQDEDPRAYRMRRRDLGFDELQAGAHFVTPTKTEDT